jgi:hypothetical protein
MKKCLNCGKDNEDYQFTAHYNHCDECYKKWDDIVYRNGIDKQPFNTLRFEELYLRKKKEIKKIYEDYIDAKNKISPERDTFYGNIVASLRVEADVLSRKLKASDSNSYFNIIKALQSILSVIKEYEQKE